MASGKISLPQTLTLLLQFGLPGVGASQNEMVFDELLHLRAAHFPAGYGGVHQVFGHRAQVLPQAL